MGAGPNRTSSVMAEAPDLHLLVTSRERLDLQVEHVVEVGGLALSAGNATPDASDAMALFARRARRVQAGFTLDARTTPAVAWIWRLVGGLPLAIELATAWANRLAPDAIASAIASNLDYLATTRRDLPARQRSLRAVLAHAWQRLSAEEMAAFSLLSLFRGSYSLEAAEAVCGVSPAVLGSLVDRSLLHREGARYTLHETLNQYAREQLARSPGRAAVARRRHVAYYARLRAEREPPFKGPDPKRALAEVAAVAFDLLADGRH